MESKGMAAHLGEPQFSDVAYRQANFSEIQSVVECFFLIQNSRDAYMDGQAAGLPIGVLNAPEDLPRDEHLIARDYFVPVHDDAPGSPHLYPGAAMRFSAFPWPDMTRAPRLGEHTAEVLGGTG
jgi:crotonobetainyl-CoA:carnitine CoA-transferase CaiB-like acyl-CoA transferase